jgi:hypothetical protein
MRFNAKKKHAEDCPQIDFKMNTPYNSVILTDLAAQLDQTVIVTIELVVVPQLEIPGTGREPLSEADVNLFFGASNESGIVTVQCPICARKAEVDREKAPGAWPVCDADGATMIPTGETPVDEG